MGYKIITDENLEQRLKKCIAHRHTENNMTESVRAAFDSKTDPNIPALLKTMMDQASSVFCLADLAGMSVEDVVRGWVELMEIKHPQLLG